MSFAKATDLLRLAEMAASRHQGVSLTEIVETFDVDHRTAQRMTRALEDVFAGCFTVEADDRRKFWKLNAQDARLVLAQGLRDSELSALDIAIRRAERDGALDQVRALGGLRDRLLAAMPSSLARRAEADAEAILEAYGFASRPGPRVRAPLDLLGAIAQALKGPHQLTIAYAGGSEPHGERLLEPHGLLLGTRRYLVARLAGGDGKMQHYRLDRISWARLEASSFARDADFDLGVHSSRSFGSYHSPGEYDEVVWRFSPRSAPVARDFVFHPEQQMTDEPDGSLTVRFTASGLLEMAWHLYQWGDTVEVIAPAALREMVESHRRGDFPALP
jgi:predicted DNA-binding transcriptional regulator YafY